MQSSRLKYYQGLSNIKKANQIRFVLLLPKPLQTICEYFLEPAIYRVVINCYVPGAVEKSLCWIEGFSSKQLKQIPEHLKRLETELSDNNLQLLPKCIIKPVRWKILEFYYQSGTQALRRRDYECALEYSSQATKLAPYNTKFWNIRSRALFGLGRGASLNRYINYLANVVTFQDWIQVKLIERILVCGYPQTAHRKIAAHPSLLKRRNMRALQVRCHNAMRQFGLMRDYLDTEVCEHLSSAQRDLVNNGLSMLEHCNIKFNSDDNSIEFAEYLLTQFTTKPLSNDSFHPHTVMILTHSMGIGGSERQTKNIINTLISTKKVNKVYLLVKEEPEHIFKLANYGERLVQFNVNDLGYVPQIRLNNQVYLMLGRYCRTAGLRDIAPILNAIEKFRPEVVHIRNGMHAEGALAALVAGVPRVVVHFGSMIREQHGAATELEKLRFRQVRKILSVCAKHPACNERLVFSANSHAAAQSWSRACDLLNKRFHIIPNIMDCKALGMSHPRIFDRTKKDITVGGVFRMVAVKDPRLWIETAHWVIAKRPNTKFILVGDGPMLAQIERMIDAWGLRKHFEVAGSVTQGLAGYLARMDIFLLSTRSESMPNSVLEAQLMGLPVIAPDVGGLREALAADDTGMITHRTASDLAQAVITAIDNISWRQDIRTRAPALIKTRFSVDAALRKLMSAYNWDE